MVAGISRGAMLNSTVIGRIVGVFTSTSPRFFLMQLTTTSPTFVGVARPTNFGALTPSSSHERSGDVHADASRSAGDNGRRTA